MDTQYLRDLEPNNIHEFKLLSSTLCVSLASIIQSYVDWKWNLGRQIRKANYHVYTPETILRSVYMSKRLKSLILDNRNTNCGKAIFVISRVQNCNGTCRFDMNRDEVINQRIKFFSFMTKNCYSPLQ